LIDIKAVFVREFSLSVLHSHLESTRRCHCETLLGEECLEDYEVDEDHSSRCKNDLHSQVFSS